MVDKSIIRKWWDIFKSEDEATVEVRGLGASTISGYFNDVETMLEEMSKYDYDGMGLYATLNPCKDALMGRSQAGRIKKSDSKSAPQTSDGDIDIRRYILIDIDPIRPAGVNSTEEEKAGAYELTKRIFKYLRSVGFSDPVIADSANGYHLYYKISLANDNVSASAIKDFLYVLGLYFDTPIAEVDKAVWNASRIVKIIGTKSNKGTDTAIRPQRMSKFIYIPERFVETDVAFIKKVVADKPEAPKPTRENGYSTEPFDLDQFITEHGIEIESRTITKDYEKIVLKECPFDCNHKDSAIFRMSSGAIAFKCFHNSCSSYGWKDLRLHYDPNAYDRQDYRDHRLIHRFDRSARKEAPVIQPQTEEKGNKWKRLSEIKYVDPCSLPFIPTGIDRLDSNLLGLFLGDVTIISGLAGSGKTSLIDFILLNAAQKDIKSVVWSGELQDFRFQSWIDQMAAGKNLVKQSPKFENFYYCPDKIAERINQWLDDKLLLYNNDYGNHWSQLFSDMVEVVDKEAPQLIVIDNLTALDLDSEGDDKNDRQKTFINDVKDFAKQRNVHVILVCHPRKEQSFHLLRMESISGSSDLINLADNVLLVHRGGDDLMKRMSEFFGTDKAEQFSKYDSVIEIAKNRSHGAVGTVIGLYFERETRRFKNSVDENIVYNWDESAPRETGTIDLGIELPKIDLPEPMHLSDFDEIPDPMNIHGFDEEMF